MLGQIVPSGALHSRPSHRKSRFPFSFWKRVRNTTSVRIWAFSFFIMWRIWAFTVLAHMERSHAARRSQQSDGCPN